MSEFHVEVVRLGSVVDLPKSDTLAITHVHGGYPCIVKRGQFAEGDLAVYIPVDALCPVARPEFTFLDSGKGRTYERIRARKLRGTFSMGLLIAAPDGSKPGDDVRAHYGIEKWEPPSERDDACPMAATRRESWLKRAWLSVCHAIGLTPPKPPSVPIYDIEGLRKHIGILNLGEEVVLTEKIHGCNSRFIWTGKRFYVGSRTMFRKSGPSVWHTVADRYRLEAIMRQYPGAVLFGEVYGSVQDLKYGVPADEGVRFVVFDLLWENHGAHTRRYFDYDNLLRFCAEHELPVVPELYRGPWSPDLIRYAEGPTTMPGANHVREGFVVKPVIERTDPHFGRVQLKLPGEGYLTRKQVD